MSETVDSLKQRLVGAFVILSLAIIFLPMIFDKPHSDGHNVLVPVPPKPEFRTIEIAKPAQPSFKVLEVDESTGKVVEGEDDVEPDSEGKKVVSLPEVQNEELVSKDLSSEQKAISKPATSVPVSKTKIDSKPGKVSSDTKRPKVAKPKVSHLPVFKNIWMVQLGTFSNAKNAYRLRDKLRNDGFDGHTKEIKLGGKKAVRVFTGPFVNKREAEKTKKKLDQKYKVDSRLIFFDA